MAYSPYARPPKRQPVKVTTRTRTTAQPAPEPPARPREGTHAVTTNQEPFDSWPEEWPPVNLPELSGYTVDEEKQGTHESAPVQTSYDIGQAQYYDYNQPEDTADASY